MRRSGVRNDRPVVAYDDWAGHAASRAWWLLRCDGHQDVWVLDGGLSAWSNAGGALEPGLVADGTFRSPEELRALYAAAGVTGETDVAAYCGSGEPRCARLGAGWHPGGALPRELERLDH